MRRLILLLIAAILLLGTAVMAWPLLSALQLRQALRSGDAARIEPCVDWPTLRTNLKATIRGNAAAASGGGWFWRKVKERAIPALADRAVDTAVTPDRLAWFLRRRMQVQGDPTPRAPPPQPDADPDGDEIDRITSPRRLKWAFFDGPSRFRIEISDPTRGDRRMVALFDLQGWRWRLTNVFYDTQG